MIDVLWWEEWQAESWCLLWFFIGEEKYQRFDWDIWLEEALKLWAFEELGKLDGDGEGIGLLHWEEKVGVVPDPCPGL